MAKRLDKFRLLKLLDISESTLTEVLSNLQNYYGEKVEAKKDKSGKIKLDRFGQPRIRTLYPSYRQLKSVQKQINRSFFSQIPFPIHVQGGIKCRSNITNAALHKGKPFKLCIDLRDFFPSINNNYVFKSLCDEFRFMPDVASILTKLTTYKGQLPQGAPTSPYLANMVFMPIDREILLICENHGITYSRFVDDLTLSSQKDFKEIIPEIISLIKSKGYKISDQKVSYGYAPKEITGIITSNNGIAAPPRLFEKSRSPLLNEAQKIGFGRYFNAIKKVNSRKRFR